MKKLFGMMFGMVLILSVLVACAGGESSGGGNGK